MGDVQSPQVVTLVTIADGAALELFHKALRDVLQNIDDPNTDAEARRSIVLQFNFTTDDERRMAPVEVKCSTKLAGIKGASTMLYVGRHHGELVAVEHNPKQELLFPAPGGELVPIAGGKKD